MNEAKQQNPRLDDFGRILSIAVRIQSAIADSTSAPLLPIIPPTNSDSKLLMKQYFDSTFFDRKPHDNLKIISIY